MIPLRKPAISRPARSGRRRLACPAILRTRSLLPGMMPRGGGYTVIAGGQNFGVGTYNLTVPNYYTFNLDLYAGGGGGGGHLAEGGGWAGNGGHTYINLPGLQVIAYGGGGGQSPGSMTTGAYGSPGSGANGNVIVGGGAAGGPGTYYLGPRGGDGGAGGRVYRSFAVGATGAPIPNTAYTVVVGAGGAPGPSYLNLGPGTWGGNGVAYFSWS